VLEWDQEDLERILTLRDSEGDDVVVSISAWLWNVAVEDGTTDRVSDGVSM
jgi:hypothetical protein